MQNLVAIFHHEYLFLQPWDILGISSLKYHASYATLLPNVEVNLLYYLVFP